MDIHPTPGVQPQRAAPLPEKTGWRSWAGFWLLLLATTGLLCSAGAHPLGDQSVDHYSEVKVTPEKVVVVYDLDRAEVATFQEMKRLDTNGDGVADDAEKQTYAQAEARGHAANLKLEINGSQLPLAPASAKMFFLPGQGTLPTMRIIATLETAPGALAAALRGDGVQAGSYRDDNEPHRIGWRQIGIKGVGTKVVDQSIGGRPATLSPQGFDTDEAGNQADVRAVDFHFTPHSSLTAQTETPAPGAVAPRRREADAFASLMTAEHLTPVKMAWLLLIAAALGGLHALAPGHGKTLVAAYLVGSRGTAWHALVLGLIVTFTHTAGIFLLGLVTLFASRYLLPDTLYPWLTAASGLVIAQVGLLRLFCRGGLHIHSHGDEHSHDHGHVHAHAHEHGHGHAHEDGHEHGHVHRHAHGFAHHVHASAPGLHSHIGQEQPHVHPHEHGVSDHSPHSHGEQEHDEEDHHHHHHHADEGHTHGHHHHHHLPPVGEAITWRSLLALGVSGGLVPCPSALVVLLSAVALHQIGFGLALIVAFSAGLALVLTAIGVAMVYARNFVSSRFTMPAWLLGIVPRAGGALIFGIGLAIAWPAVIVLARSY